MKAPAVSDQTQPGRQQPDKPAARRRGAPNRTPYYKRAEQQEQAERKLAAAEGREPDLKRRGFYRRAVEEDAARQGLTVEEYGVYKGSTGSVIKPVNSAGGLLAISIVLTVITAFCTVLFIHLLVTGQRDDWGEVLFGMAVVYLFTPWSWWYYFVERRAERLRAERGKTLIRPE